MSAEAVSAILLTSGDSRWLPARAIRAILDVEHIARSGRLRQLLVLSARGHVSAWAWRAGRPPSRARDRRPRRKRLKARPDAIHTACAALLPREKLNHTESRNIV
jgi:hypothetical protein